VLGFMRLEDWLLASAVILAVNAVIYASLRSGRNERLSDPSLTALQMLASCLLMAMTMVLVDEARGALLLLYLVLLMFGVFRLRRLAFMGLGAFALVCYGAAIVIVRSLRPWAVDMPVELLQLAALAAIVPCGGFFAGYVGGLRRELRSRQVDLQRAREMVYELESLDELTGLTNRHSILVFLREEMERAERLDQPLSIALLDLDRFKEFNRRYGHETGDEALRRIGALLRESVRTVDGVGRYSGEEFLVVMPDTGVEDAKRTTERLREALVEVRFPELASGLQVSVSAGVAQHRPGDGTWSLVERAREAADKALAAGGHRVHASTGG